MRSILASLALGLVLGLLLATAWLAPRAAGAQPPPDAKLEDAALILRRVREIGERLTETEAAMRAGNCSERNRLLGYVRFSTRNLWWLYHSGYPINAAPIEDFERRISAIDVAGCPPINTPQRAQQVFQEALSDARNARTARDCYAARVARDRARAIVEEPATSTLFTAPLLEQWKSELRAEDAFSCTSVVPQTATPCPLTLPGGVTSLNCRCRPGPYGHWVWGSFYYAEESGLCAAALHAGAIRPDGGSILAGVQAGRNYYVGNVRNGVQSRRMNSSNRTIIFAGTYNRREEHLGQFRLCKFEFSVYPEAERRSGVTCRCLADILGTEGTVYGSGPYASDSALCAAARHAGAWDGYDGLISINALPGQNGYRASTQNGITSQYWGYFRESMSIIAASD